MNNKRIKAVFVFLCALNILLIAVLTVTFLSHKAPADASASTTEVSNTSTDALASTTEDTKSATDVSRNNSKANMNYIERVGLFDIYDESYKPDIVFLGDSLTYKADFNELLGIHNSANRGIGSDTTAGVLTRLDGVIRLKPKKVFIMIGINDIAQGYDVETIVNNYTEIVSQLKKSIPKVEIYIQSVLPFAEKLKYSKSTLLAVNERISKLAADSGCTYIDIYSEIANEKGYLDKEYTLDGLHLLGSGYAVWRDCIKAYI